MWPFLFILAMVPLAFYWSDSLVTLFPQWEQYFPAKTGKAPGLVEPDKALNAATPLNDGTLGWVETTGTEGYVAWILSADGVYRLAVGCRNKSAPTIQVTHISGNTLTDPVELNYQYGVVPLKDGFYNGSDVVNATAQFEAVYLQTPTRVVLAQFTPDKIASANVARSLAQNCAEPAQGSKE